MAIKSDRKIYPLIEELLKASTEPMTCAQLMDDSSVRREALKLADQDVSIATNKVSDSLGLMWRKGLVEKFPAANTSKSKSRYAYRWKEQPPTEWTKADPPKLPPVRHTGKMAIAITEEENGLTIDFGQFIVSVRSK